MEVTRAGELLRAATPEDEQIAEGVRQRSRQLFEDGRRLAAELNLPIEIIDVEVLLDGHQVTLYFVRWGDGDERPLVSALSKKYESMVALRDLALPAGASGCGQPDCGSKDGGGCSTCGTDGGCSTGGCSTGCGSKAKAGEVRDYFLSLRNKMEQAQRTPLL